MRIASIILLFCVATGCTAPKEITLPGGEWKLAKLYNDDLSLLKQPITLRLDPAGQKVNGYAGCNQYAGTFKQKENTITFNEPVLTRMYCEETSAMETKYIAALTYAETYTVKNNTLRFFIAKDLILEFTR